MKRVTGIVAVALVGSLLGASDVRGGSALAPAGKVTGPAVTATIVIDVTGPATVPGKGLASVRLQRASVSTAALFTSSYVNSFADECLQDGFTDLQKSTNFRFTATPSPSDPPGRMPGLISTFIDTPAVLNALFAPFGPGSNAAITDTDYAACTEVNGRKILSFTAIIQFQP